MVLPLRSSSAASISLDSMVVCKKAPDFVRGFLILGTSKRLRAGVEERASGCVVTVQTRVEELAVDRAGDVENVSDGDGAIFRDGSRVHGVARVVRLHPAPFVYRCHAVDAGVARVVQAALFGHVRDGRETDVLLVRKLREDDLGLDVKGPAVMLERANRAARSRLVAEDLHEVRDVEASAGDADAQRGGDAGHKLCDLVAVAETAPRVDGLALGVCEAGGH